MSQIQYELHVYDDGDCAVRKINAKARSLINILFVSFDELQKYVTTDLDIRWPIQEVVAAIEMAKEDEWIEFK